MKLLPKSKGQWIRLGILATIAAVLFAYFYILPFIGYLGYEPQNGDILFQSLQHNELVDAIEGISESPYSHCGVVMKKDGEWVVIEALGMVKYTPLFTWLTHGRFGRFAVYRLHPDYGSAINGFIDNLKTFERRPYDFHYAMDDEAIYCSELVFKAFRNATGEELGRLVTLGELNWKPFEQTIRKYENGNLPLDRQMITPGHLAQAAQIQCVYSYGYD